MAQLQQISVPREARMLFRRGKLVGKLTSGLCSGYMQATIAVFDSQLADSFLEFCKQNSAPCSLLYVSRPGEVTAPPLAEDSDVRNVMARIIVPEDSHDDVDEAMMEVDGGPTAAQNSLYKDSRSSSKEKSDDGLTDLAQYRVWRKDKEVETTDSLMKYSWERNVTFYIGCSFAFEEALQAVGVPMRNVEQQCNVSMYRTNIPCKPVGPFRSNVVVSMRPVPRKLLKETFETTQSFVGAHGAPIHIGDPEIIGIRNLKTPDWGGVLNIHEDEVPVFWACGLTALESITSSGADLAFTHSPGSMFVCDVPVDYGGTTVSPSSVAIIDVAAPLKEFAASVVSTSVAMKIRKLQDCLSSTICNDDLLLAASSLSHSNMIVVMVPCSLNGEELRSLEVLLCALASLRGKTKVYIDGNQSDMHADIEQVLKHYKEDNPVALMVDANALSPIECDHLIVIGNSTHRLSERCQPVITAKCHTIAIGSSSFSDLNSVNIDGDRVLVLVVLALSICLLQTCSSHVRYICRGICEEPVEVKNITDLFTSNMKGPECFDGFLALVSK